MHEIVSAHQHGVSLGTEMDVMGHLQCAVGFRPSGWVRTCIKQKGVNKYINTTISSFVAIGRQENMGIGYNIKRTILRECGTARENDFGRDHRTGWSHKTNTLIKTRNGAKPRKAEGPFRSFAPLSWAEGRDGVGRGVELELGLELVELVPLEPLSFEPSSFEPLSSEPLSFEPLSFEPLSFEPLSSEPLSFEPSSSGRSSPESSLLSPSPPVGVLVGFGVVEVGVGVLVMVLVLVEWRLHWGLLELSREQVYPAAVMRKGRPYE